MDTDTDLLDFAAFDSFRPERTRPVVSEPEQDKMQRAMARDVDAAPYRAEHYGF